MSQENPSEEDVNQGTVVVSNLDSSVSNEELCHIFGSYGEIKQVILLLFFFRERKTALLNACFRSINALMLYLIPDP